MLLYCHWGIRHFAGDLCAVILSLGYKTFCWGSMCCYTVIGLENSFTGMSLCYYTIIDRLLIGLV